MNERKSTLAGFLVVPVSCSNWNLDAIVGCRMVLQRDITGRDTMSR